MNDDDSNRNRFAPPRPQTREAQPHDLVVSVYDWAVWGGPGAPPRSAALHSFSDKTRDELQTRFRGLAQGAANSLGVSVAVLGSDRTTVLYIASPRLSEDR